MSQIKLYVDEDAMHSRLVSVLRSRGVAVVTVSDSGLAEKTDEEQASRGGRLTLVQARKNSSLAMPTCVRMVRKVDALMVEWFGMLRQSEPPSGRGRRIAICSASRTNSNPMATKRRNHPGFGSIDWELGHQPEIFASAMKASISSESSGRTSSPKVSMWKRMADLTSARASS